MYFSQKEFSESTDQLTSTLTATIIFIPRFYQVCFAFSIIFGELRSLTGTFWAAVLIHAVGNAFGHPLAAEYVQTVAGMEYLASISNGLILIAFAYLLGAAIHRWRVAHVSISG